MMTSNVESLPERRGRHTVTINITPNNKAVTNCTRAGILERNRFFKALHIYRSTIAPNVINIVIIRNGSLMFYRQSWMYICSSGEGQAPANLLFFNGLAYILYIISLIYPKSSAVG